MAEILILEGNAATAMNKMATAMELRAANSNTGINMDAMMKLQVVQNEASEKRMMTMLQAMKQQTNQLIIALHQKSDIVTSKSTSASTLENI